MEALTNLPRRSPVNVDKANELPPPLAKRDFTVEELRQYDGTGPDGRVLIACNGKVFDVTKGRRFYGPGGPYATFAGRDASRGLATFSLDESAVRDQYDDLSDLNPSEMESVREWEIQFTEKYDYLGKLLNPNDGGYDSNDDSHSPTSPPDQETTGNDTSDKKTD